MAIECNDAALSEASTIFEYFTEEFGEIFNCVTYPTRTQRVMDILYNGDVVFHITLGDNPQISGKGIPTMCMPLASIERQLMNTIIYMYHELGLGKTEFYENHSRKYKFK